MITIAFLFFHFISVRFVTIDVYTRYDEVCKSIRIIYVSTLLNFYSST